MNNKVSIPITMIRTGMLLLNSARMTNTPMPSRKKDPATALITPVIRPVPKSMPMAQSNVMQVNNNAHKVKAECSPLSIVELPNAWKAYAIRQPRPRAIKDGTTLNFIT